MGDGGDDGVRQERTTIHTKPDTTYRISVTGVIDAKKNIYTDSTQLRVTTSPAAPEVRFQAINQRTVNIGFDSIQGFDEYHFKLHPPIPGIESGVYKTGQ